jgi:hypothetical protein
VFGLGFWVWGLEPMVKGERFRSRGFWLSVKGEEIRAWD